jgi:hypothetical protein
MAVATDQLAVYPTWDLTMPALPARSVLYHLAPIGVGTPNVESLTGYLGRLAEAHSVSLRTLLVHVIVPLVGRRDLSKESNSSLSAFWTVDSRALNGTGVMARVWAQALADLTGCPEMAHMTLLTWRHVLPSRKLLRRVRAWCPVCYEEWRRNGTPIYEPLRWALTVVSGCPRHRCLLRQECPHSHCRQSLPLLASRYQPGHCSACGGWLGAPEEAELSKAALSAEALAWQSWVDATVGMLLAASPMTTPPPHEQIAHLITQCAGLVGGLTAFAHTLEWNVGTVCQWRQGKHRPSLEALVALCYRLDTSLRDFLLADPVQLDLRPVRPQPPSEAPITPARARKRVDVDRLRCALEKVLQFPEDPPASMRQVAKRLGYAHADLHRRFPDLCRSISARHLAHRQRLGEQRHQRLCGEVRAATFHLHAQGVYPSSIKVAGLLTYPSHFRHPAANAAWHSALHDLGWERQSDHNFADESRPSSHRSIVEPYPDHSGQVMG